MEILSLDSAKASENANIPTKIIKVNADVFSNFLLSGFNHSIKTFNFPPRLTQTNITPVFNKGDKNFKENYRQFSILSNISKIFEWFMFKQISNFVEAFFSNNTVVFEKPTEHNIVFYPCLKTGNQQLIKENI